MARKRIPYSEQTDRGLVHNFNQKIDKIERSVQGQSIDSEYSTLDYIAETVISMTSDPAWTVEQDLKMPVEGITEVGQRPIIGGWLDLQGMRDALTPEKFAWVIARSTLCWHAHTLPGWSIECVRAKWGSRKTINFHNPEDLNSI